MRTLADRRHEDAKAEADDRDLESRSDRRREEDARETHLKALATRLVALKESALGRLGLDAELREAIDMARAIRSAAARNRQINVVRQHLRALGPDADALARRLETPGKGAPQAPAASPEALAWLERLAAGGDAALGELIALHPGADRQRLRQRLLDLGRARKAGEAGAVARAEQRLAAALAACLR